MASKIIRSSSYTQEQLEKMSREEIVEEMDDREIAFCEYYVKDYNAFMAAVKAGYKATAARNLGNRIRKKQHVTNYIAWLKLQFYHEACVEAVDILNSYAKMAFYDVTDFLRKEGNNLRLKSFEEIDGQIIQEITQNSSGAITVKFPDRIKAFEKLENYMDTNPYDWKRKLEEKKVSILEEKMAIERIKAGIEGEDDDDGFFDALERSALNVFKNEETQ